MLLNSMGGGGGGVGGITFPIWLCLTSLWVKSYFFFIFFAASLTTYCGGGFKCAFITGPPTV